MIRFKKIFNTLSPASLRGRLIFGFLSVLLLMSGAGALALMSQEHTLRSIDGFLDTEARLQDLSDHSNVELLKARRCEKDFLLHYRELGFDEARSRYATLLTSHTRAILANMATVRQ